MRFPSLCPVTVSSKRVSVYFRQSAVSCSGKACGTGRFPDMPSRLRKGSVDDVVSRMSRFFFSLCVFVSFRKVPPHHAALHGCSFGMTPTHLSACPSHIQPTVLGICLRPRSFRGNVDCSAACSPSVIIKAFMGTVNHELADWRLRTVPISCPLSAGL